MDQYIGSEDFPARSDERNARSQAHAPAGRFATSETLKTPESASVTRSGDCRVLLLVETVITGLDDRAARRWRGMVEKFFQIGASCFRSVSTERIQKKNRDGTALTAEPTSARNGLLSPNAVVNTQECRGQIKTPPDFSGGAAMCSGVC